MANNWIPVKYGLPKETGDYIIYIHRPNVIPAWVKTEEDKKQFLDSDFVTIAFFNKEYGEMWFPIGQDGGMDDYPGDITKRDTDTYYYISHWMPMPDKPEK